MFKGKPIIGVVGGIGSGKTFVARVMGEMGCFVIDSDALVREAYEDEGVRKTLREWWGDSVFTGDGKVDRGSIARIVFGNDLERRRLEGLVHPWVDERRRVLMDEAPGDAVAFVWDTPLLLEVGLNRLCDAVVFVEAAEGDRLGRVAAQRGWGAAELIRREKLQMPLDKKREMSDHVLVNTAKVDDVRCQIREILSRIVADLPRRPARA